MPYGWNSAQIRKTIERYKARKAKMEQENDSPEAIECLNRLIRKMEGWEADARAKEEPITK